jgi:hypothetical protein
MRVSLNIELYTFFTDTNFKRRVYDLVVHSDDGPSYLAIFSSGIVGFTSRSSGGQSLSGKDDDFVTT